MTATDELRRLLDERGVEWRRTPHYSSESQDNETVFEGNGIEWYANDHLNGRLGLRTARYGCVGCPMAGGKTRIKEFARWPKYEDAYKRAFGKMLEVRKRCGLETQWANADEVFQWWTGGEL